MICRICFYLSKQAGYEPQVRFNAGCVSELNFKFKIKINSKSHKKIEHKVKTQNLVKQFYSEKMYILSNDPL